MKKFTRKSALLLAVAVIACMVIGGTYAILQTGTLPIFNRFAMAEVETVIEEQLKDLTKTITIENTGKTDVYTRLRLSISGVKPEEIKICKNESEKNESKVNIIPGGNWVCQDETPSADSFWYYTPVLPAGSTTLTAMQVYVGNELGASLPADFKVIVYHESAMANGKTDQNAFS